MEKDIRKDQKDKLNTLKKFYAFVEHNGSASLRTLQRCFTDEELKILGYTEDASTKR
jgi:hypothetical protein